jgi:hypothetical protein
VTRASKTGLMSAALFMRKMGKNWVKRKLAENNERRQLLLQNYTILERIIQN